MALQFSLMRILVYLQPLLPLQPTIHSLLHKQSTNFGPLHHPHKCQQYHFKYTINIAPKSALSLFFKDNSFIVVVVSTSSKNQIKIFHQSQRHSIHSPSLLKEISLALQRNKLHKVKRILKLVDFVTTQSNRKSISYKFNVLHIKAAFIPIKEQERESVRIPAQQPLFNKVNNRQAKSQCSPSSREINSLEKVRPGILPRFFNQKIETKEPKKKIPSQQQMPQAFAQNETHHRESNAKPIQPFFDTRNGIHSIEQKVSFLRITNVSVNQETVHL